MACSLPRTAAYASPTTPPQTSVSRTNGTAAGYPSVPAAAASSEDAPGRPIVVRAAPEVVYWIETHGAELRAGLARRNVSRVTFEPRSEFAREGFDVSAQV